MGHRNVKIMVAPNNLMIIRMLQTKAQVICAQSKENISIFQYLMIYPHAQNAKLTVNFLAFPSVKFCQI